MNKNVEKTQTLTSGESNLVLLQNNRAQLMANLRYQKPIINKNNNNNKQISNDPSVI